MSDFDVSTFLKFLFSVVFLFVCAMSLMLYIGNVTSIIITLLLRLFALPAKTVFRLGSFHIAPLQARIMFQNVFFQTENYSLRIVDGFVTFAFWGFWFGNPRWSKVHEYMISDDLIGTRCRIRTTLKFVKGTITAIDAEKKKFTVQLDETHTASSDDEDEEDLMEEEMEQRPQGDRHTRQPSPDEREESSIFVDRETPFSRQPTPQADTPFARSGLASLDISMHHPSDASPSKAAMSSSARRSTLKEFISPAAVQPNGNDTLHPSGELGDEVLKVVDAAEVYIRSRPGLCHVHLNGMRVSLYNATGKYQDLERAAAVGASASAAMSGPGGAAAGSKHSKGKDGATSAVAEQLPPSRMQQLILALGKFARRKDQQDLDDGSEAENEMYEAARKLQRQKSNSKSLMEHFFNFFGCVEMEIYSGSIDLGGVGSSHPYFLHISFLQAEGRTFLTKDGCPTLDLYRTVSELTLKEVDIRMAKITNKLTKTQVMRNATLLDRARLMFGGVADDFNDEVFFFDVEASTDLVNEFGIFMNGKDKGSIHIVFYKDTANVYAGEATERGSLPTTGVEVLIDSPRIRYGPWLEYCRFQLWQYFLPPNYLPVPILEFEAGKPRPNAGFGLVARFMRDTIIEVPFRRRTVTPSPPFGIADSKRKGMLLASIGEGSQYIQPAFFTLPGEEKQTMESLFMAKNVTVRANCVLERETVLAHVDSLQFFLDRQDSLLWNGRKLWNMLPKLSGATMYWYMVYIDFFLDLLNDWQFAASMYHDAPLSTEAFNTFNRAVRYFVPNVKRFEIFLDCAATIYINLNTNNVVYADDPNDLANNCFAVLKLQAGRFSMVLPSDQYQLSHENEVIRPIEGSAHDIRVHLSLPRNHPLFDKVSAEIPWARAERFKLLGKMTQQVPNQSTPLPTDNMNQRTGRTRYGNFFDLDLELVGVHGTLMGTHIKALLNCFENTFLDSTFTIAPDELFWLLTKLQSHATSGKNKQKEFKQYLEFSQPAGNDMEICVTIRLVDLTAALASAESSSASKISLSTGLLTFTYAKQFAATDTAVTLAPVAVRLLDNKGKVERYPDSFLCTGEIAVNLTKHFGPMPLKPKIHETVQARVDGVRFEMTADRAVMLAEVLQATVEQLGMEDLMMEAEVDVARTNAELAAERVVRAGPLCNTRDRRPTTDGLRRRRREDETDAPALARSASMRRNDLSQTAKWGEESRTNRRANTTTNFWPEESDPEPQIQPSLPFVSVEMNENGDADRRELVNGQVGRVNEVDEPVFLEDTTAVRRDRRGSPYYSSHRTNQERLNAETTPPDQGLPVFSSVEYVEGRGASPDGAGGAHGKKKRLLFFRATSTSSSDGESDTSSAVQARKLFANKVSFETALGFAQFMEEVNRADEDAKDYGLKFLSATITSVHGVVRVGVEGCASVELPLGINIASSTVNDGNSNMRLTAAVKDVRVDLMLERNGSIAKSYVPGLATARDIGDYIKVMSLTTTVCARHYVAYPFDGSLESHQQHQKKFMEENDYEGLISFVFPEASQKSERDPSPSFSQAPQTARAIPIRERAQTPSVSADPPTQSRPSLRSTGSYGVTSPPGTARHAPVDDMEATTRPGENGPGPAASPLFPSSSSSSRREAGDVVERDTEAPHDLARPVPRRRRKKDSASSSSSSQDTTAHPRGGDTLDEFSHSSAFTTLNSLSGSMAEDKLTSGKVFATCLSHTEAGQDDSTSEGGSDFDSFLESTPGRDGGEGISNAAFFGDKAVSVSSESGAESFADGLGNRNGPRPSLGESRSPNSPSPSSGMEGFVGKSMPPGYLFYETFTKHETHDEGSCMLDYWPSGTSGSRRRGGRQSQLRNWTRYHGQLPAVGFEQHPSSASNHCPSFFVYCREQLLQEERDVLAWAFSATDNRERSKDGSTSKHFHVSFVDPLTLFVTPEAAVLAAVCGQMVTQARKESEQRQARLRREMSAAFLTTPLSATHASKAIFAQKKAKSKNRVRQKRWRWEDNSMSIHIPSIELKVMSFLPLAEDSRPHPGFVGKGAYTSSLCVSGVKVVLAEKRPPAGEDVAVSANTRFSASLNVDVLALITQIEAEPMEREGNLYVEVPHLWYDQTKDTVGVVFVSDLGLKLKRDFWRGNNGGACNITVADIGAYTTRDQIAYMRRMYALLREVVIDIKERFQDMDEVASGLSSMASSFIGNKPITPDTPAASASFGGVGKGTINPPGIIGRLGKGQTIQGKGFIKKIYVSMTDVVRSGRRMVVQKELQNHIRMDGPFANFVLITPNVVRDRVVTVQGVGEVEAVDARLFPNVIHVVHPGNTADPMQAGKHTGASKSAAQTQGDFSPSSPPSLSTAAIATPLPAVLAPKGVRFAANDSVFSSSGRGVNRQLPLAISPPPRGEPSKNSSSPKAAPRTPAEPEKQSIHIVYDCAFTVHRVDASVNQSDSNMAKLQGRNLTGCSESRVDRVASRECVQTEALTEIISNAMREALRIKAQNARTRAQRSRYPAPPETTDQLLLKATASFFAQELLVVYIAETLVEQQSETKASPSTTKIMKQAKIFTATITDLATAVQFTEQHNQKGDQTNAHMTIGRVSFKSPFHPHAAETLSPQVQQFLFGWRSAFAAASSSVRLPAAVPSTRMRSSAAETASRRNSSFVLNVQAKTIAGVIGLPQRISQTFLLPQLSCFMKGSSDGRLSVKAHLHPFHLSSETDGISHYHVTLPHMYVLYAHDDIKMNCNVIIETIAITISPLFVNHTLMTYEKLSSEFITALSTHIPVNATLYEDGHGKDGKLGSGSKGDTASSGSNNPNTPVGDGSAQSVSVSQSMEAPPPARPSRRRSLLFLLQGVRFSYVTSMTTLRFSIRNMNAIADTAEGEGQRSLQWVVNVTNAQVALVDRDDHDQAMATTVSLSRNNRSSESSRTTSGVFGAGYAESVTSSTGSARLVDVASNLLAEHPLGGFLWGSLELSLTLSSGKVDKNKAKETLQENASFNAYSMELQKALVDSLGHSTSTWELSVHDPLVILRVGLDKLLSQCFMETKRDIEVMKTATREADEMMGVHLDNNRKYRQLQKEKQRFEQLARRAQKERMQKLRSMTERVARDVAHRRGGFMLDNTTTEAILDMFNIRQAHKVAATVSNFLVVVPFGDAAYRNILEEVPSTFACGKADRHIHNAGCLGRRSFVPHLALKAKVDEVSCICSIETERRYVPVLVSSMNPQQMRVNNGSALFTNTGEAQTDYTDTQVFCGRFDVQRTHVYFTDGSPIESDLTLASLLRDTRLLGGEGYLTSSSNREFRDSRNSFSIATVEAPIRIQKKESTTTVGAVVDVSQPKARVSSRLVSILSVFSKESSSVPFPSHELSRRAISANKAKEQRRREKMKQSSVSFPLSEPHEVPKQPPEKPNMQEMADHQSDDGASDDSGEEGSDSLLLLDISGRLEAGEVSVFAFSTPDLMKAPPTTSGASVSKRQTQPLPVVPRRVGFASPKASRKSSTAGVAASSGDDGFPEQANALVLTLPLPAVGAKLAMDRGGSVTKEDLTVVRVEIRAGAFELGPSITSLAEEMELCAQVYGRRHEECVSRMLTAVKKMEAEVPSLSVPLHCPLVEVLLPMPRAYASALAKLQMSRVRQIHKSATAKGDAGGVKATGPDSRKSSAGGEREVPGNATARRKGDGKAKGFTSIHVCLSDLRVTFTAEPIVSTSFSVYLDEGGSVDCLVKLFKHPAQSARFINKFPDTSVVATLRQLRAECQTKLEVKSVEMFLPAVEAIFSKRSAQIGPISNLTIHLPFHLCGGEPNVILRVQHISQIFTVVQLWSCTLSDTLAAVRRLFMKGAAGGLVMKRVAETQLAKQITKGAHTLSQHILRSEERRFALVKASHAMVYVDLGAGNSHDLVIGGVHAALSRRVNVDGGTVALWLLQGHNIAVRSEGVLSGSVLIGRVLMRGFVIQNIDDAEVFLRSPEQRTFRESLLVQQVHVNFKERQLKDVFECQIGEFTGNSMDGVGEEGYTTTDLDLDLTKGTLGVTPSTVPAFLNFIRNVSGTVTEQRRIAAERLKGSSRYSRSFSATQRSLSHAVHTLRGGASIAEVDEEDTSVIGRSRAQPQSPADYVRRSFEKRTGTPPEKKTKAKRRLHREHDPIPFLGSTLYRIPCGQLRIGLEDTAVLLGAVRSTETATGCVVVSFPKTRFSFAECPCEDYTAAKKVLVIETHNVELFRPGTPRVVILGFAGINHFEFYTRQVLGNSEVGFTLTLRQTHPWTGNPRFRDFEEMVTLVKSFTDKKNADVFHEFGRLDSSMLEHDFDTRWGAATSSTMDFIASSQSQRQISGEQALHESPTTPQASNVAADPADAVDRTLKALRSSKFSPQLRFGGDVSVNTEVILNWLGITEKMLPQVLHVKLCDKLEKSLNALSDLASERVMVKTAEPEEESRPLLVQEGGEEDSERANLNRQFQAWSSSQSQWTSKKSP